jgi:hypothetical protein
MVYHSGHHVAVSVESRLWSEVNFGCQNSADSRPTDPLAAHGESTDRFKFALPCLACPLAGVVPSLKVSQFDTKNPKKQNLY